MKSLAVERKMGFNINKWMKERFLTVEELAEMLVCSPIHIQAILTGSIGIEEEEIDEIARVLNVERADIVKEPEEDITNYNVHYMGKVSKPERAVEILDEVDLYVRLLNRKSEKLAE